jgi:hypothetical protein
VIVLARKFCPQCREEKTVEEFHSDRRSSDGLQGHCKMCKIGQVTRRRTRLADDTDRSQPERKVCAECRMLLPGGDFYTSKGEIDGLSYRCKGCTGIIQSSARYGISPQEVTALREAARCGICGCQLTPKTSNIDHCHKTGIVRGALCGHCNAMLGMARDVPEVLEKGAEYLRAFCATAKSDF